jgi:signal transduction histidine kinase
MEPHPTALSGHGVTYEADGRSRMSVPLVCRSRVIGAMTLVAPRLRHYGDADLELCDELARRMTLAIDNARLYEAARESLAARDEFLAAAAHELRGPLTALRLAVQGLMKGELPPRAARNALEVVQREDGRLGRFIEDLIDLGRIRRGQLRFTLQEVDLGSVVRAVVSRWSAGIARSGSSVSISTEGDLTGQWDGSKIEQVVDSLLSNAIKYGDGKPIEFIVRGSGEDVTLSVVDHGIGIPPGLHGKLFDPYQRAVGASHYGGLGLGLYIARTIVEALGGTIGADSRPDGSTVFRAELPRTRQDA